MFKKLFKKKTYHYCLGTLEVIHPRRYTSEDHAEANAAVGSEHLYRVADDGSSVVLLTPFGIDMNLEGYRSRDPEPQYSGFDARQVAGYKPPQIELFSIS